MNKNIAFLSAFLFGISAAHVATIYYLAGGMEISGGTAFMFLSLISFDKYLESREVRYKSVSFVFYLLALASHELVAVTPLLLIGLIILKNKKALAKKILVNLWPFILLLLLYLYLDFFKIGILQDEQQYQKVISLKSVFNSLAWYVSWAMGIPEMLVDFVRPGLKLNPSLMLHWSDYYSLIFPTFFLSIAILVLCAMYLFFNKKSLILNKKIPFLSFWFLAMIGPMLLLPQHKSTHYLTPALPAFCAIISSIAVGYWNERQKESRLASIMPLGLIFALFLLSFTSVRLGAETYIAANRGKAALILVSDIRAKYPNLPKGAVVYFKNDPQYPYVAAGWGGTSKQAAFVLNNSDALQLLYKDPSLRVYYEDMGEIPKGVVSSDIIEITAKIN